MATHVTAHNVHDPMKKFYDNMTLLERIYHQLQEERFQSKRNISAQCEGGYTVICGDILSVVWLRYGMSKSEVVGHVTPCFHLSCSPLFSQQGQGRRGQIVDLEASIPVLLVFVFIRFELLPHSVKNCHFWWLQNPFFCQAGKLCDRCGTQTSKNR